MTDVLSAQARKLLETAVELEKAARHARIAADHFKSGEVPRACAHTVATEGHIHAANDFLKAVAMAHSLKAVLP